MFVPRHDPALLAWDLQRQWCEHRLAEAADDDLAGFVAALGSVPDNPDVAAVLRAEKTLTREVLTGPIATGQHQGALRADRDPTRVAVWVLVHHPATGPQTTARGTVIWLGRHPGVYARRTPWI